MCPKCQMPGGYLRQQNSFRGTHSGGPEASMPSALVRLAQEPEKAKFTNER